MTRVLFWIALLILVIFAVRSKLRKFNGAPDSDAPERQRTLEQGEAMACCAHCHVYFPASEALRSGDLDYCSPAHLGLPEQ
jgi:uncharacterized protein